MGDLIDRQAAIDALEKWESESTWDEWCYDHKDESEKYSVISPSSVVFGLPSAQSDSCNGCKWEYAFGYGECDHCKRSYNDMYEVENGKTT